MTNGLRPKVNWLNHWLNKNKVQPLIRVYIKIKIFILSIYDGHFLLYNKVQHGSKNGSKNGYLDGMISYLIPWIAFFFLLSSWKFIAKFMVRNFWGVFQQPREFMGWFLMIGIFRDFWWDGKWDFIRDFQFWYNLEISYENPYDHINPYSYE